MRRETFFFVFFLSARETRTYRATARPPSIDTTRFLSFFVVKNDALVTLLVVLLPLFGLTLTCVRAWGASRVTSSSPRVNLRRLLGRFLLGRLLFLLCYAALRDRPGQPPRFSDFLVTESSRKRTFAAAASSARATDQLRLRLFGYDYVYSSLSCARHTEKVRQTRTRRYSKHASANARRANRGGNILPKPPRRLADAARRKNA
jgi:hypothetical protein